MNSRALGTVWEFLHCIPWIYPTEVLKPKDATELIMFMDCFTKILPCRFCRESAGVFKRDLRVGRMLLVKLPVKGYVVTRGCIANTMFTFHEKVNRKLEYPRYEDQWQGTVRPRDTLWESHLIMFLFCVIWNYQELNDDNYILMQTMHMFFSVHLKNILKYTEIGNMYASYLKDYPLDSGKLRRKSLFFNWFYAFYETFARHSNRMKHAYSTPSSELVKSGTDPEYIKYMSKNVYIWSAEEIRNVLTGIRARHTVCVLPLGKKDGNVHEQRSCD